MDIISSIPALKEEAAVIDNTKKAIWAASIKAMNIPDIDALLLIELAILIVRKLPQTVTVQAQNNLANDIQYALFYILILIDDFRKCAAYFKTKANFELYNPAEDFWFQRVDEAGTHEFNAPGTGIYLVNTIPPADNQHYYNSEIYNSSYTAVLPKNVIVNPYP